MTSTQENRFLAPAWMASFAIHTAAVGLALLLVAQVKPAIEQEVFKWEVALVQPTSPEPQVELAKPVEQPAQKAQSVQRVAPTPPVDHSSEMVTTPVAPQQTVQMVHPVIEPQKPVEQNVEPPPQKIEPVERKVVEVEKPKVEPVQEKVTVAEQPKQTPAVTAEPIVPQAPSVAMAEPVFNPSLAAHTYEPPKYSASREATPDHDTTPSPEDVAPIRQSLVPVGEQAVKPAAAPAARPSDELQAVAAVPSRTEPQAAHVASAAPGPEVKTDHRWLAESLWRRVAELKRYPSSARLNGQEGKVILKAVIRADGQLAEVSVQKSSGHTILDTAAMEAVKLACPLHMKHAIGKPEIVVSLPIVYSLAN